MYGVIKETFHFFQNTLSAILPAGFSRKGAVNKKNLFINLNWIFLSSVFGNWNVWFFHNPSYMKDKSDYSKKSGYLHTRYRFYHSPWRVHRVNSIADKPRCLDFSGNSCWKCRCHALWFIATLKYQEGSFRRWLRPGDASVSWQQGEVREKNEKFRSESQEFRFTFSKRLPEGKRIRGLSFFLLFILTVSETCSGTWNGFFFPSGYWQSGHERRLLFRIKISEKASPYPLFTCTVEIPCLRAERPGFPDRVKYEREHLPVKPGKRDILQSSGNQNMNMPGFCTSVREKNRIVLRPAFGGIG